MTPATLTVKSRSARAGGGRPRAKAPRLAAPSTEASILTFNIAVAAEPRAAKILRWLRRRRDEVIVLSETSTGAGTELLRAGLEEDGYLTIGGAADGERGVMIATRLAVASRAPQIAVTVPCRAQALAVETSPALAVLGIYVPSRDRSPAKVARKQDFIASLLAGIEGLPIEQRSQLIVLGDYNAVARDHQPALPGFFPYEYDFHEELARLGMQAAHELRPYGKSQPHSWIGRTGLGYLYDYAHLGGGLSERITSCRYLHGPREQRLSDHAALAIRLRLD